MSPRVVVILAFLLALPVGWIGYKTLDGMYLSKRAEKLRKIESLQSSLALVDETKAKAPRLQREIRAIADRTFGPDLETVDHRLRSRLNRIREDLALQNHSVSTGEVIAKTSPSASELPRGNKWKPLREEIDFVEVNGFISGDATYAQAIELLARLDAEPWIKRIFYVKLDPKQGGAMFRIQVRLTTLFLPGYAPSQPLPEHAPQLDRARIEALAAANPFVIPKPVNDTPPTVVAESNPDKPRFPYDKWVMTGIVSGPGGAEVWLLEAGSGETKLLTPGEQLSEMKLVDAEGDAAEFELDGRSIHLSIGQSLGEGLKQRRN